MNNKKYWIALSSIEQLDSVFIQKLYNFFGDIETAYKAELSDYSQIDGLSKRKTEILIEKRKSINPDKELDFINKKSIKFLSFDDENYPYMLRQISNPPMILYYKGNLFDCNLEKTVAFVGSRRASGSGKESVKKIISDLANIDITIISGLATGIDSISHKTAIENNLKTIGVIASGFNYTYPSDNKYLYEKIVDNNGAIITEYYPTFEPIKFRFPQRNRIITGLSYGTVVGEAAIKSGALISANLALEQGRELMCIPGAINNINTEGVYKLLKDGASMVTKGEDILNTLGWEIIKQKEITHTSIALSDKQKNIFDIISIEPKCFDEIQTIINMDTNELLVCLTEMELSGLIEQTDGDMYKRRKF